MKRFLHFSVIIILSCCLLSNLAGQNSVKLPRSTPETEGVSSKGIIDFLNAIDTGKIEIHSFIFMRHGKIISEGWWNPYGPEYKHIMYSASKTFAATGIGLAIAEKKLNLSDKVVSFFPASIPDTLNDYMKMMTVKDLLTMSTGQDAEPRRGQNDDWIKSFLAKAPTFQPGTVFKYNNTASFMLSAIVQQVTGETLFDYLQPRILRPLGIRGIDWDLNPQGINLGMIGLRLRTEDMAKFGQLLLQQGEWNDKQLIPKEWIKEATGFKIKSLGGNDKIAPEINDWKQGYCYQMWRCRNNGVRLDGMAGQFVILLPDKDAVVVLTANSSDTQKELDLVWEYLLPAIKDSKSIPADNAMNTELQKMVASLSVKTSPVKSVESSFATRVSGKSVEFQTNNFGIQALGFKFSENICLLAIKRDNITYYIKSGLDKWIRSETSLSSMFAAPRTSVSKSIDANYSIIQPVIRLAASYLWTDNNTLEVTARFIEESLATEGLICKFTEEGGVISVSLERKSTRGSGLGPRAQATPIVLKGKIIE
jgi:CubicO group peptidase (beta-lactamase class C family)